MKFASFGDSVIFLAVKWRVPGICRNVLSGDVPRGDSSLAAFLIVQSGDERSVNKPKFHDRERTKAVVNGYNGQKTLSTSDFLFIFLPPLGNKRLKLSPSVSILT